MISDAPYSVWDHFFFPQVRSPTIVVVSTGQPHYGLVLAGGDRLGLQRWGISGYVQPPGTGAMPIYRPRRMCISPK